MNDGGPWFWFVIAALATWRVTHLLVAEDGPFSLLARLRAALGRFGRVLDCFYCLSLWIAAPLALLVTRKPMPWLCAWLALSGAACLLERVTSAPVVMQPLPAQDQPSDQGEDEEGDHDALLRTETRRDPD